MKIIKRVAELRSALSDPDGDVGFVPTMGYLHEGHIDLIKKSVLQNPRTVVSIFINPKQFGEGEDFEKYPRDAERDREILESHGTDILFMPESDEIYPPGYSTYVSVAGMDQVLCGRSRPGHFTGVATIVLKLVNMVEPRFLYLGKKDAQQLVILKKMLRDLNVNTEIRAVETRRARDGLALSSRNSYLSDRGRNSALAISGALKMARSLITKRKILDPEIIREKMLEVLGEARDVEPDYVELVSLQTLKKIERIDVNGTLIAIAAYVEGVRLIDNTIFGEI